MNALLSFFQRHKIRIIGGNIILLGFFHALLYALVYPPWGLLDESQHFHYIQLIAEEHRLPVMWQDKLSDEIMDSIFAVKRYVTLGSETMPDRMEVMSPDRLDSESYEAYHPPLYYTILAFIYPLGPPDVLSKLFILRIVGSLLGAITLIVIWKSCHLLWPDHSWIAIVATLFVALHPERTASVARVSNDLMLEVMCALAFGVLALALARGTHWKLSLWLGLSLGLAATSKLSALFVLPTLILGWIMADVYHHSQSQKLRASMIKPLLMILLLVTAFVFPILIRNVRLYHDLTGIQSFIARTGSLTHGTLSELIINGTIDLFRNSWVILWKGATVVSKTKPTFLISILIAETTFLVLLIGWQWWNQKKGLTPFAQKILIISGLGLSSVSFFTLYSYVSGLIPVVQGRFLLPATVPTAWFIGFSLWLVGNRWRRNLMAGIMLGTEIVLGMTVLFFHTLPNFYAPRHTEFLGYWKQTVYLFQSPTGMFWDKPDFITAWTVGSVLVIFAGCLTGSLLLSALEVGSS